MRSLANHPATKNIIGDKALSGAVSQPSTVIETTHAGNKMSAARCLNMPKRISREKINASAAGTP